ncbi:glycosyltransferase family 2 protein [Ectobacillus sp. JY-23]|uniref:glycosyltransferase family 2 protein n=1 Tax=Ectobacillus sp. JY-23 TaxID=2933872 RepID=UPI001FF33196|nr:glycosyltransferase family A protein [Ectobacillus sp. JY-23]UOY92705.1 glycosyltransferase family 2 protein [Ectobacillus sp. JY-23]
MQITVFTPTYNRGYIIENLYKSLQKQTFRDFEWLVIDDGSIDNTEELFKEWKNEKNFFKIRYYKVENGGKHRAINKAIDLANGDVFFIVDSDDYLIPTALEKVASWFRTIENQVGFCGVSGNRGRTEIDVIGTTFKGDYIDATSLERNQFHITGDKAEVFYTHVLKKYKFPEYEGERFISEATVWEKMAYEGYKIRWFNETIYICNYLEDGLTQNMIQTFAKSPRGTALYMKQQIKFHNCGLKGKMAYYNLYYSFVKSQLNLKEAAAHMETSLFTMIASVILAETKKRLTGWRFYAN